MRRLRQAGAALATGLLLLALFAAPLAAQTVPDPLPPEGWLDGGPVPVVLAPPPWATPNQVRDLAAWLQAELDVPVFPVYWDPAATHTGANNVALAATAVRQAIAAGDDGQVDLLGYGSGGLLLRTLLHERLDVARHARHVVLVGTPNQGSFAAYAQVLSYLMQHPGELNRSEMQRAEDWYIRYREAIWEHEPGEKGRAADFFTWLLSEEPGLERQLLQSDLHYPAHPDQRYTRGFHLLASWYAGIYRAWVADHPGGGAPVLACVEPVALPFAPVGLDLVPALQSYRELPDRVELHLGLTTDGHIRRITLPVNPTLLRLNSAPHAARTLRQKWTSIATVRPWPAPEVEAMRVADQQLLLDAGDDGWTEVSRAVMPLVVQADEVYHLKGISATEQMQSAAVRERVARSLQHYFTAERTISLEGSKTGSLQVHRPFAAEPGRQEGHIAVIFEWSEAPANTSGLAGGDAVTPWLQLKADAPTGRIWLYRETTAGGMSIEPRSLPLNESVDTTRLRRLVVLVRDPFLSISYGYAAAAPDLMTWGRSATAFVFDISNSMAWAWEGGPNKLVSVQEAARMLLGLLRQNQRDGAADLVGVAAFAARGETLQPLTADFDQVERAIAGLRLGGGTNIGAGLEHGFALLESSTAAERIIVLLTDGVINRGLSAAAVLETYVPRGLRSGIRIYTVGVGDADHYDEPFLEELAERSGGHYQRADTAFRLENIYLRVQHDSSGDVLQRWEGQVGPGERQPVGQVTVSPHTEVLRVSLNWPGSTVDLLLTDPRGRTVGPGYPGAQFSAVPRPFYVTIQTPIPGDWQVAVYGQDVRPEGDPFEVLVSAEEREAVVMSSMPVLLVALLGLMGLALMGAQVSTSLRQRGPGKAP